MPGDDVLESLPAVPRLALAYAPKHARAAWLRFLVLDSRLAQIVREAREPMLAQIRLAWWRERLQESAEQRPRGEPLLALLDDDGDGDALVPLVDGWEALLGEAPLPREKIAGFAEGRGEALRRLAATLDLSTPGTASLARQWALADLAARLSHPDEREHAAQLAAAQEAPPAKLPREMRPLVVLHGVAVRRLRGRAGFGAMLAALRLGILGR